VYDYVIVGAASAGCIVANRLVGGTLETMLLNNTSRNCSPIASSRSTPVIKS
jgi:choline dehydrogenase-like flavoprotein